MAFLKTTLFLLLLSLLVITGCSNNNDVKITEVFRSNILDNNAKMFTFSIIFINRSTSPKRGDGYSDARQKTDRQGNGRGNKGNSGGKGKKQGSSHMVQMSEELETRLVERFEDNGYCRKGFFELDRTLNKTIYTIHGECSESATSEDRKNFAKPMRDNLN